MKTSFVWGIKTQANTFVPSSTINQSRAACLDLARASISEKEKFEIVRVMYIRPKGR
jgi:hypothetical protein